MKGNSWPPIFGLVITAVLVILVLPNPLRIPQNNPAAQAEYAPVPGDQDDATNANFGETGSATSEGIGASHLDETVAPQIDLTPPEPIYKARNKSCTKSEDGAQRQAPDPLSPPCVTFWDGDNGGTTYQGVTADTITVVFYNDLDIKGDMSTPWNISQEDVDHERDFQQTYLVKTVKSLYQYFQKQYQTYGRLVHLIAVPSRNGIVSTCAGRTSEAAVINKDYAPFAVVHFGDNGQCFLNEMGKYKVPGFGLNSDVPREKFYEQEGLVWGFYPDQEAMAGWSASFICQKLDKRKARLAGEDRLRNMPRKFGLLFPDKSQRGPENGEMAGLLVKELKRQCGIDPDADNPRLVIKTFSEAGATQANTMMVDLFNKNVTTMICYCVPVPTETTVTHMQNAATALNFYPEWYWDHTSRMFRAIWNREYGAKDSRHAHIGTSYHWRNPRFEHQHWYLAFKLMVSSGKPNMRFGFDIYHLFLNLYQGIQAAGPDLNPDTVKRGMFTFKYGFRPSEANDFFRPVGGYGTNHPRYTNAYSFIDTGFAWWWDRTGTPPGESSPTGCLRAVRLGKRFHGPANGEKKGTWPSGDDDLMLYDNGEADPSLPARKGREHLHSPCFQDDTKIERTGSIGF